MKIVKTCSIYSDTSFTPKTMLVYDNGQIYLGNFSLAILEDLRSNFNIDIDIYEYIRPEYMRNLTLTQAEKYGWRRDYKNENQAIPEVLDLINTAIKLRND